jgi:hypothetical protein
VKRCNLSPTKVLALVAIASGLAFTAGVYAYRALHSCDHDGKVQEQLRWVEQELCMRRAAREKRDLEMCYSLWTPEDFASLWEHWPCFYRDGDLTCPDG